MCTQTVTHFPDLFTSIEHAQRPGWLLKEVHVTHFGGRWSRYRGDRS